MRLVSYRGVAAARLPLTEEQMNTSINQDRIRKALSALKQAERELQTVLDEAEQPKPDPPPQPTKIHKSHKTMRRVRG
jgi:hypothetical protein